MADPGGGGPWGWRTLGMADPGDGGPEPAIRGDSVVSLTTPVVGQSCQVRSILVSVRTYLMCRLTISHVANIRIIYYTITLCKVLYYSIACTVIVIHTMYYVSNRETRCDSTYQMFHILWVIDSRKTRTNNKHKLKINRHRILAQIMVRVGKTGKAACTLRLIYKAGGVSSCGSSHRIFFHVRHGRLRY